jgi:hypothetical protein
MPTITLDDKHDATIRPTEKIKSGVYRCELTVGLIGGVLTKSQFIGNGRTAQQAEDAAMNEAKAAIAAGKIEYLKTPLLNTSGIQRKNK